MEVLQNKSVMRVQAALAGAGMNAKVIALADTARSAQDAANSMATELGSIVKSLVFLVGERPIMVLVSGDRICKESKLPELLGLAGPVRRADAATVRAATGFAIGGVSPVGLKEKLPVVIDASLGRFDTIYAAAGHPHCVFDTDVEELAHVTDAIISLDVAEEP
jgi:prolyl-tRNA editing enzyme YbaK/EbsC (Cys-tRNA(Pro) deacylase)